jgi:antirestriction protein ArdC
MTTRTKRTPEQQTAFAERRTQMQTLSKQIAAMSEAERQTLAAQIGTIVTCEQRALSPYNTCMVAAQRPGITIIGGFQQWKRLGRAVRKGEKGVYIWVPLGPRSESDRSGDGTAPDERRFRLVAVFDVSQTDEETQENN